MGQALPGAPVVSVVIPVYNQGSFLRAAIESVLSQDYQPLELIVVDDGSTDATPAVLAAFKDRIVTTRQENKGAATALNEGIQLASGDLICWLSADDEFLPGKVSAQVAAFAADSTLGMTYMGYDVVDQDGRLIRRVPFPRPRDPDPFVAVFWENPINGSTVMIRRAVLDRVGLFDSTLRADVDADMWLRVARVSNIGQIDGSYLRYRVHAASLSANRTLMRESMTGVRKRYLAADLVPRLRERGASKAATMLARMAAEYAWRGLHELAAELERSSRRTGRAWAAQAYARLALAATRWTPAGDSLRTWVGRFRRHLWRYRESRSAGR